MLLGMVLMVVGVGIKLNGVMEQKKLEVLKGTIDQTTKSGFININIASLRELVDLPGIGEKMAQRIVDYRLLKGRFNSKEEIIEVKGIGPKTYESLKSKITL